MAWIHRGVFGLPKAHQNPCARWFLLPGTRSPKTPHWQTRGSGISAAAPEANTGNQKPTPAMPGTYFFPRAQTCGVAVVLTTFPVPFYCIGWSPWCCRLPHHCFPCSQASSQLQQSDMQPPPWNVRLTVCSQRQKLGEGWGGLSVSQGRNKHTLPGCCKCPQNRQTPQIQGIQLRLFTSCVAFLHVKE